MTLRACRICFVPFVVAALLGVAGCGGSSSSSGNAGKTTAGNSGGGSTTLTLAAPDDAANFDPMFSADPRSTEVIMNTYDPYMTYGLKSGPDGSEVYNPNQIEGLALSSLSHSADGKTWTLQVRPGMHFAAGQPIDAKTVAYAFKRNLGLSSGGGAFIYGQLAHIASIKSITATGPMTVQVKTTAASPLIPQLFALSNSVPMNEAVLAKHASAKDPFASTWLSRNTAGSGPYEMTQWSPGSQITLTANPHYWQKPPFFKQVVVKIVPSAATSIAALERGDVDMVENLSSAETESLNGVPNVKVVSVPSTNGLQMIMNVKSKPFDNVLVRRAIAYATPYSGVIQSVYHGNAQATKGPIPVGFPGVLTSGYPYGTQDLAKARSLLAQAGYPHGFSAVLDVSAASEDDQAAAVQIQSALAQVGIKLTIDKLTAAVFAQQRQKGAMPLFLNESDWWAINALYPLSLGYTCKAFFNYGAYCDPAVDSDVTKAVTSADATTRTSLIDDAQRRIEADVPMVWIAQPNFTIAMRSDITGYVHLNDGMVRYYYLKRGS